MLIDDAAGHDARTLLGFNHALDLDPFSTAAIKAAHPAFAIFMNKREVLAMAADAKRMRHALGRDDHAECGSGPSLKVRAEWLAKIDPLG